MKRSVLIEWMSRAAAWMGLITIGILAVPVGILGVLISIVWDTADQFVVWIHKKETENGVVT